MKKITLFVIPLFLAVIIFAAITFFLNRSFGKGALQVTSIPKSKVYLDGKEIGNTPLCKCDARNLLKTGDYTIKLIPTQGNFKLFEEKITINKSTLAVVDREFLSGAKGNGSIITLSPLSAKKEAELLVVSIPNYANVVLDNNPVGITPLLIKNLAESDHSLSIEKNGYKSKLVNIRTALGYKLTSLILLGINPVAATPSAAPLASISAVILDTPTGFLRVRENNLISSAEITRVSPGEVFDLVEEKEGWFEIKLKDGKMGWISSRYANKQ